MAGGPWAMGWLAERGGLKPKNRYSLKGPLLRKKQYNNYSGTVYNSTHSDHAYLVWLGGGS